VTEDKDLDQGGKKPIPEETSESPRSDRSKENLESENGTALEEKVEAEAEIEDEGAPTEETFASLKAERDRLRNEADEYLDGWQRARAEFSNYKKRMDREVSETRARVMCEIAARYLGVLDDLERALAERNNVDSNHAWAEGIELIHQKLQAILTSEGIEPIPAEGEIFDPNFHEAISYEESDDHEDGQVIAVIQEGYKLGDRVVRPALVRVAK
jgi:molecular chaperone GrpE